MSQAICCCSCVTITSFVVLRHVGLVAMYAWTQCASVALQDLLNWYAQNTLKTANAVPICGKQAIQWE